jgi:hypothetical protein
MRFYAYFLDQIQAVMPLNINVGGKLLLPG